MKKKYYLSVSSWNLLESFVTESISPNSFYGARNFGSNLSRYVDPNIDRQNVLILSEIDPGGNYTFIIDEDLIDPISLTKIEGTKYLYGYNKTVYFRKGLISFRFASQELCDSLIAESKIIFEVKCIDKYFPDFSISKKKALGEKLYKKGTEGIPFDENNHIDFDNRFNVYKGALTGYICGIFTSIGKDDMTLRTKAQMLKNEMAGLNTQIMVNDIPVENPLFYLELINECKNLFLQQNFERTNLFDILKQQFNEVVKLTQYRADKLNASWRRQEILRLREETKEVEKEISDIEREFPISQIRRELYEIKEKEKKNGQSQGKGRIYFKKGTPEYDRKKELESYLEEFKKLNPDYSNLKKHIKKIKSQIGLLEAGQTEYDSTITAIFTRISDICNDLIKKLSSGTGQNSIDVELLPKMDSCGNLYVPDCQDDAETVYYEVVLNYVLHNQTGKISESSILNIISESANKFKEHRISESERGETILTCLRNFWKYKNGKATSFSIPDNFPILQSIMSFFVKPFGFDQIERYMMNAGYQQKCYAFSLWGGCLGFAGIPKTFTVALYKDTEATLTADNYLNSIRLELSHIGMENN